MIEKQVVWTYIEDPIFFDQDIYLQLIEKKKNVPILFNYCLQILNNDFNSVDDFVNNPENLDDVKLDEMIGSTQSNIPNKIFNEIKYTIR